MVVVVLIVKKDNFFGICSFDVEFHEMMTKMFEGKKLEEATYCPTCNQPRSVVVVVVVAH